MSQPLEIFCCYARRDHLLLQQLKSHLTPLQRKGIITLWADSDIHAGAAWEEEIRKHLEIAHIILLLVSPDFMASDYCYSEEMIRALDRQKKGEAYVVPVILRPVHWQDALGQLQALPKDGKPVTSWPNLDDAFYDITNHILQIVNKISSTQPSSHSNTGQSTKLQIRLPDADERYAHRRNPKHSRRPLRLFSGPLRISAHIFYSSDEHTVLYVLHSKWSLMKKLFFPSIAIIAYGILEFFYTGILSIGKSMFGEIAETIMLLIIIILVGMIFSSIINYLDDVLIFTNRRIIIIERRFFFPAEIREEFDYKDIRRIKITFAGFFQRFWDVGSIRLEMVGSDQNSLKISTIDHPYRVRDVIQQIQLTSKNAEKPPKVF